MAHAARDPEYPAADQDAQKLLAFYDREKRDLPWRRRRDGYAIWLSEVMLQQTQVATVLPRYRRFLERFPTVEALAAAPIDHVLAEWAGLGYYRRARQLHQAARQVAELGAFPATAADLRRLPGVGDYTAAAVASIAFGEQVPVLDGNVERVLCRLLALEDDPKRPAVRRRLLEEAARLLTPERPGDGNQALMELGATVCTPTSPACPRCPLAERCAGRGEPERYPLPRRRRATEKHALVLALVECEGRWLLCRRPDDHTLMAGLWELPNAPAGDAAEVEARLAESYGGRWRLGSRLAQLRHAITYRDLRLEVHRAELAGSLEAEHRHVPPAEATRLASSSILAKVARALASLQLPSFSP